jgi:hypothetical protein
MACAEITSQTRAEAELSIIAIKIEEKFVEEKS